MNPFSNKQTGFTLIELLTVMLILVAMASVTIETASELAFQNRYEVTKDRYEKIKRAIIGRPDVLINGQPDISGFVADVGRLPFALQELLSEGFCNDTTKLESACTGGTLAWTSNGYGWNGPYIYSTKAFDDASALSDGWGNTGLGNYGWNVSYFDSGGVATTTVANISSMTIQSPGSTTVPDYGAPYPSSPEISNANWNIDINNLISVSITTSVSGTCGSSTCSDPNYTTQLSCEVPRAVWNSGTSTCSNSFYTLQADCETLRGTWLVPTSKFNCEAGGATWAPEPSKICLRIKNQDNSSFIASSANFETIPMDGYSHKITFTTMAPTKLPIGIINIGVYTYNSTDCNTSTTLYGSGSSNLIKEVLTSSTTNIYENWE